MSDSRIFNKFPTGFLFLLIIVILVFLIYPISKTVLMSIQYWYLPKKGPNTTFVGLKNFFHLFSDKAFLSSLGKTFIYITVTVFFRFVLGYLVAFLLDLKFKGRALARALIIIPWAIPEVVACLVWILMYDQEFGIINYIITNFHILHENVRFLEDPGTALPAAMVVNIWKGFPFVAIMILAGLQSIPKELYEAATVDGASGFQKFRNITVPMLKPVSKVVFLLLIIWTMKDFAIAYLLAEGGPSRATEILTIYVYKTSFKYFDFGVAAAGGFVLLLFSLLFTVFYMRDLESA
ncbi:carbohydrate ABC transporter permease [Sediminispirochaeta bajacaliforniensis]|uniref:carbohydrate ABC transporter permease n=1 Tax=Sediminispirochaeta bajacaliforniensis TaxID=148 RepID=UPI000364F0E9|nr:sugar ABC transporter permease [Sediminispirochaeta bajacaliforniensis]